MSDNYTKMMNCPEIQDGWKPKVGDWTGKGLVVKIEEELVGIVIDSPRVLVFPHILTKKGETSRWIKGRLLWLPSIEQLMEMVEPVFKKMRWSLDEMYHAFHEYTFAAGTAPQWDKINKRPNQELWLAFVMYELHGKKWSETEWVKS